MIAILCYWSPLLPSFPLADTINMEDGKLESAELPETKIFIWEHSVSATDIIDFLDHIMWTVQQLSNKVGSH